MSDFASASQLKDVKLRYDTVLTQVLPADIAVPLKAFGIETAEDLYECAANAGAGWFRPITGIDAERATALMHWLSRCGEDVGEVTERFFCLAPRKTCKRCRWQHKRLKTVSCR